ncbi:hypothetical protein GPJ56_003524 [Histomonas meleagridis]|uniref:uncharacterized protein n=1 Tax=Histomonas meleagridis TaxID=135588 RepID=UPI003559C340|nr:hypothetical protein GPJ56_003524 [Histomonas meleagridis]KAH0806410.1 hypothetical protein GO595_000785 [Histomonas meleagridis]
MRKVQDNFYKQINQNDQLAENYDDINEGMAKYQNQVQYKILHDDGNPIIDDNPINKHHDFFDMDNDEDSKLHYMKQKSSNKNIRHKIIGDSNDFASKIHRRSLRILKRLSSGNYTLLYGHNDDNIQNKTETNKHKESEFRNNKNNKTQSDTNTTEVNIKKHKNSKPTEEIANEFYTKEEIIDQNENENENEQTEEIKVTPTETIKSNKPKEHIKQQQNKSEDKKQMKYPIALSISPTRGSCNGGTHIYVRVQESISPLVPLYCIFGASVTKSVSRNDTHIECISPRGNVGLVNFKLSYNNNTNDALDEEILQFEYVKRSITLEKLLQNPSPLMMFFGMSLTLAIIVLLTKKVCCRTKKCCANRNDRSGEMEPFLDDNGMKVQKRTKAKKRKNLYE